MIRRALHYQQRLTGDSLFVTLGRYFIFISGGFIAWSLIAVLYLYLNRVLSINIFVSYAAGLVLADIFTFVYHRYITFRIKTNWKSRFIKFTILVLILTFVNWAIFSLIVGVFALQVPEFEFSTSITHYGRPLADFQFTLASDIIISFIITLFISVINFSVNRIFIFRQH